MAKKHIIFLIIFLLLFSSMILYLRASETTDWDSSQALISGKIFQDYIVSGFPNWDEFIKDYDKHLTGASWYSTIDSPAYPIIQAISFMIFGLSFFAAKLTNIILIFIGSFFLFFLAKAILKSSKSALFTVILFLLIPITIELSGVAIVDIPVGLLMCAWFWITFYREKGKQFKIKIGEKELIINLNWIFGAIFLSLAVLIRYQNIGFVIGFYILYLAYLLFKNKEKGQEILVIGIVQGIIFTLITGYFFYWLFFKSTIIDRILYEGTGREITNYLFYLKAIFPRTLFVVSFAFVPLFFKKGRNFFKQNVPLLLMILSIFILSSLFISNQQLRYCIFCVPLLIIIAIKGIELLRYKTIITLILSAILIFSGISWINSRQEVIGFQDYELIEFMKDLPLPRLLIYMHSPKSVDPTGYYPSPDNFLFSTMLSYDESSPSKSMQYSQYVYWRQIQQDYESFLKQVDEISTQLPTFIIAFRYSLDIIIINEGLEEHDWTSQELSWYKIYRRELK